MNARLPILLSLAALLVLLAVPPASSQLLYAGCSGSNVETVSVCPGYKASVVDGECSAGIYRGSQYVEIVHTYGLGVTTGRC